MYNNYIPLLSSSERVVFTIFNNSKHTCHFFFNPLNIFFIVIKKRMQYHFLNDKNILLSKSIHSYWNVSIHQHSFAPNYYFLYIIYSKTLIFIHNLSAITECLNLLYLNVQYYNLIKIEYFQTDFYP